MSIKIEEVTEDQKEQVRAALEEHTEEEIESAIKWMIAEGELEQKFEDGEHFIRQRKPN